MNSPPMAFEDYLRQITTPTFAPAPVAVPAPAPPPAEPPKPPPAFGDYLGQLSESMKAPMSPAVSNALAAQMAAPPAEPAPAGGPVAAAAPPAALSPAPAARSFPLVPVGGGGVIPAHEVDVRGPSLKAAQAEQQQETAGTIQGIEARTNETASREYEMALGHEKAAQAHADAVMQSAAERQQELTNRLQDFDKTAKQLGQFHEDPERFWASRSTPQKISSVIGVILGGFVSGFRGGSNVGLDVLNQMIDRDVAAQRADYMASRDASNAKQTAFALAMQKYGSVDAATAMARAAGHEAVDAQLRQTSALWKGTDAANRAALAMQQNKDRYVDNIRQGIQFVPATSTGRSWVDPETGLVYSENEAKKRAEEARTQGYKLEEIAAKEGASAGGKVREDTAKMVHEDTAKMSHEIQQAQIPELRSEAETALKLLNEHPGSTPEYLLRTYHPLSGPAMHLLSSDEVNKRERAFQAFKNRAMKALAGNVTEAEAPRLEAALDSNDPVIRKQAVVDTLKALDRVEANIRAGYSDEARATYDARLKTARPSPAAPTGARPR